jgi:hypothetical protein
MGARKRQIFGAQNTPSNADVHGLENFTGREMNGRLISFRKRLHNFLQPAQFACGKRGYRFVAI